MGSHVWAPQAVSEQELAEKAMDRLPAQSAILGDRNFGVLWVAYARSGGAWGSCCGEPRCAPRKLFQGPISRAGDYRLVWQASRFDGGKHHRLPAQATVADRLRKSSPCMEAAGILRRICAPSSGLCDCITWRQRALRCSRKSCRWRSALSHPTAPGSARRFLRKPRAIRRGTRA